jgi:hypothetical protein
MYVQRESVTRLIPCLKGHRAGRRVLVTRYLVRRAFRDKTLGWRFRHLEVHSDDGRDSA